MIIILFLLTLAIGLLAQWHVKQTYARHSRTPTAGGCTVAITGPGKTLLDRPL